MTPLMSLMSILRCLPAKTLNMRCMVLPVLTRKLILLMMVYLLLLLTLITRKQLNQSSVCARNRASQHQSPAHSRGTTFPPNRIPRRFRLRKRRKLTMLMILMRSRLTRRVTVLRRRLIRVVFVLLSVRVLLRVLILLLPLLRLMSVVVVSCASFISTLTLLLARLSRLILRVVSTLPFCLVTSLRSISGD